MREGKGVLALLTKTIAEMGGNIISLTTYSGAEAGDRFITVKVNDVAPQALREALTTLDLQVVDFR